MSAGYDAAYITSRSVSDIAREMNDIANQRIALSNELLTLKKRNVGNALNESDLADMGRRIADYARNALEAKDEAWRYLPSFRDEVAAEALAMLKLIIQHERK